MSKPSSVDEFLGDFVFDANNLLKHGLYVDRKHVNIKIRAFIKCIAGHMSKSGYEHCTSVRIAYHHQFFFNRTNWSASNRCTISSRKLSTAQKI